jgi:uncharacterized protein YkwD
MRHFTSMLRIYAPITLFVLAASSAVCQQAELGPAPIAPSPSKAHSALAIENADPSALATTTGSSWLDISNRETVRSSYLNVYLPTAGVPMGWTGSIAANNAGTTTDAFKSAVLARINWFRAMAGLSAVTGLDATYSQKDQQAALMFSANRQISHTPPNTWLDWSAAGAEAASNSNICSYFGTQNWTDSGCIALYVMDGGSNNAAVGHRRWLFYPQTQTMGTGDVPVNGSYYGANAVWVFDGRFGSARPAARDNFVAWPPPGYVPYQLVYPRWSFSYPGADFSNAAVTMTRGGSAVAVSLETLASGYGENTIVWVPDNQNGNSSSFSPVAPVSDTPINVTISNVLIGGTARTFNYTVTAFDPNQAGTCAYSLDHSNRSFAATGGSDAIQLSAGSGCAWMASSNANWISISSNPSGSGTGTVTYNVAANSSDQPRTGSVTIEGQTFTVTQAGIPSSAVPTSWVTVISKNSGKCLDVPGSSMTPGMGLIQYTCGGTANQKFQFVPVAGGYEIVNQNSGLAVDIPGSSTTPGASFIQWSYAGTRNQIFTVTSLGDGSFSIQPTHSGLYLDVAGSSTADAAPVLQWAYTGGANQKWILTPVQ